MFDEVKTTRAYWNLLKKATAVRNPRKMGPIKRDDNSLAIDDKEKAALMNTYFATIGEKLANELVTTDTYDHKDLPSSDIPKISTIHISEKRIKKKVESLKPNKSTGPDGISPKLLKLAGDAIVIPLANLFRNSVRLETVYNNCKNRPIVTNI